MKKNADTHSPIKLKSRQQASTLIEVLVAMLILSFGILGMISTQVNAMHFIQSSSNQVSAAIFGNDIVERMRANEKEAKNNKSYIHSFTSGNAQGTASDCVSSVCSPAELAEFDLNQWEAALNATLPVASGSIEEVAPSDGTRTNNFLVTIRWDDDHNGSRGTNCDPATKTAEDLDCWEMAVGF